MTQSQSTIYLGDTPFHTSSQPVAGGYVELLGETYYCIRHYDQMPPFFMNLVSSSDHWLFISSAGGLTAGRANAETALFPYETDDKITAHSEHTGSKTIFLVRRDETTSLWEPFSARYAGVYRVERHLYKNIYGNKLIFEERNRDLQLTFRYAWRTSDRFGFVKTAWLENTSSAPCRISLLDGLQNILPYGATTKLQTNLSNLLQAYHRSELETRTGLGIFSLSATITDQAEPSESLRATVVWQVGLTPTRYLLSPSQLDTYRQGESLTPETDVRGSPAAYFVQAEITLNPNTTRAWHLMAEVNQDGADVANLVQDLQQPPAALTAQLEADIAASTDDLVALVAAADGLQTSGEQLVTAHHFANVMFNIMRGGVFAAGYRVDKTDLLDFVRTRNRSVLSARQAWFDALPASIALPALYARAVAENEPNLQRLCYEYLPLTFSRRHGDPSRPWNHFSINLRHANGSPRLDYQGNWRDIFQNWEALAYAFPACIEGLIAKFLNATTADGYNPYRVTRDGIEWEVPEPENPWANIGYWSDHQIIYLQKLLEFAAQVHPDRLETLWHQPIFAYADVPYRLHPYQAMLEDWYNTIDFDAAHDAAITAAVVEMGTDARLLRDADGAVIHVTMIEKLLVLLLTKLTNLVPDGGIWMNTQRPEWNDANNALAGKGLSVVTVAYLRRFVVWWRERLTAVDDDSFTVNQSVNELFTDITAILTAHQSHLNTGFDSATRRAMMNALGEAATTYRTDLYAHGLSPASGTLLRAQLVDFLVLTQHYLEATLQANRRANGLYHAYNILHLTDDGVSIAHLYPMLEGQVAILSAGLLSPPESLALLRNLRRSFLYCPTRHTYMLYPNRALPGFRQKNRVLAEQVAESALVQTLIAADDRRLLRRDRSGAYHFNGAFRNARDVQAALAELAADPAYTELVAHERQSLLELFEATFDHRAFTGRSGTFFAFEGLGSVYWHMVSKLLLAVQECYFAAVNDDAAAQTIAGLAAVYDDVRQGLGFNKSPAEYGAFPTDPYSHTPEKGGARQPGMTGQVKEEILTRWGELGVHITAGSLHFAPTLLHRAEFLSTPTTFVYIDVTGQSRTLSLPADSLAFTFCQTPIVYLQGVTPHINIIYRDGRRERISGNRLSVDASRHIFERTGHIRELWVTVT